MKKIKEKKDPKLGRPDLKVELKEAQRMAAYYRWLERGAPPNDDWNDWFDVENRWRDNIVPANND